MERLDWLHGIGQEIRKFGRFSPEFPTWKKDAPRLMRMIFFPHEEEYSCMDNLFFEPMAFSDGDDDDVGSTEHAEAFDRGMVEALATISSVRNAVDMGLLGEPPPSQKPQGTKVFIGHGHSPVWRDLKDFLKERLGLDVDEFNMESSAGMHTIERLTQMLDDAAFAFIVMTAEDEQPDGKVRARENVVHEAGLFQGRLGFRKAIILMEEGCEEFSNIVGLTQIRFPKGRVMAEAEEIRKVLEREKII